MKRRLFWATLTAGFVSLIFLIQAIRVYDRPHEHDQISEKLKDSPHGYLCRSHDFGRLNNIIREEMFALLIANIMGRTLLVSDEFLQVYNISDWQSSFPNAGYIIARPFESETEKLCQKSGI